MVIYQKRCFKFKKSNTDSFINGIEFGYIQKMSLRVRCGWWASCYCCQLITGINNSIFFFFFPICLPFIFKNYHPAVTTCFLSPDMNTHSFTLCTEYYSLLLSSISNYTWMINIHLKVKTCYEASPHLTPGVTTWNIRIPLGKIIMEISGYLYIHYLNSNDNTINPRKEIFLKFYILIRSVSLLKEKISNY